MKKIKDNKILAPHILGIDLGNKGSGNTAFCYLSNNKLLCKQTKKVEDELSVILKFIELNSIRLACIDAPLSLPGVYFHDKEFQDYMYREGDKACGAMSPMFIGAFTARAIQLKNLLLKNHVEVIEVYPKKLAEILELYSYYPLKKEKNVPIQLLNKASEKIHFPFAAIGSMHQFDALLCWQSGYRYINQQHLEFGHKKEGIIVV